MKKNILKCGLLAMIWPAYILPAMAGPEDPPTDNDPPAPIDEWIVLLLIAGVGLCICGLVMHKIKSAINPEQ